MPRPQTTAPGLPWRPLAVIPLSPCKSKPRPQSGALYTFLHSQGDGQVLSWFSEQRPTQMASLVASASSLEYTDLPTLRGSSPLLKPRKGAPCTCRTEKCKRDEAPSVLLFVS